MGIAKDITESIKARESLIFIETIEEIETITMLQNIAVGLTRTLISWDPVNQFKDISPSNSPKAMMPMGNITDLNSMLSEIRSYGSDAIFVLRDVNFYVYDNQDRGQLALLVRNFKNIKELLRSTRKNVVILGSCFNLARELSEDFSIFYFKRATVNELENIYLTYIANGNYTRFVTSEETIKDNIVNAAKGLTADQFKSCLAKSLVRHGKIDAKTIELIMDVKKQIINKNGILEYIEESVDISSVGGLSNLKEWLKKRKAGFTKEARDKGLPEPKGLLVFGVPGTGKSLSAKAVSAMWNRPILRFDLGKIFGSFVGESEKNIREALRVAESVAPCILWIDELEKAFAGSSGGHETTVRVLGNFLTWMQEKKESVFVIATANDVSTLPPEFLRKGRFDEIFFVNVPNIEERKEIFRIHLQRYKHDPAEFAVDALTASAKFYTGAEIEQAIIEAGYNAFFDNRQMTDTDIRNSLAATKSVYSTFVRKMDTEEYKTIIGMAKKASPEDREEVLV